MQRVGEGRARRFRCCHRLVSRFRCCHRLVSRFVPAFRSFGVGFQQLCWRLTAALCRGRGALPVVSEGRCKDTAFLPRFQIPPSDLGRFSAPVRAIFSSEP